MWYVHNNEVVYFMSDYQNEIDAEIVEAFFPQSYTQGHTLSQWAVDTNTPYVIETGERIEEDELRVETAILNAARKDFFKKLGIALPTVRNRHVRSITAHISPVYGAQLVIYDGKNTKQTHTITEQTLFRVMGLCSKPEQYLIDHRYTVGTNSNLMYHGATFNLIVTHKARSKAG